MKQLSQIVRGIRSPSLILDYIQGTTRMFLYKYARFMIRHHIKAQFESRKLVAKECSTNGSCISCGCKTDDLFFANKACSLKQYDEATRMLIANKKAYCYDKMLNRKEYNKMLDYKNW